MAMNGNEGGSAYPPNPDVKSGSCLIAGFHQLSEVRPSYWNAYKTESGATFSIDMVRLKLSYLMPKPKTESYGLDEVMRDATRAAEAWNRSHEAPARSRGQAR